MYSINLTTGEVIRDSDGVIVSPCQSTQDPLFIEYTQWVSAGNTPTEIQAVSLDTITYTNAVQGYLDAHAQSRGWDSIYTAALRASYPGPWQSEGVAYAQWMDACWLKCHLILADVLAGVRTAPTIEQVFSELPIAPVF